MTHIENDSDNRTNLLKWLADCQKHNSIALPKDFEIPASLLEGRLQEDSLYWSFAEVPLSYEPRSVAVSERGGQVAVGTKSGFVHVVTWNDDLREWKSHTIELNPDHLGSEGEDQLPRAVRGLAILDSKTLVAGFGSGHFRIITLPEKELDIAESIAAEFEDTASSGRTGAQRFIRLIHLYDPQQNPPECGALVLGLTRGGDVFVLRKERDGRYLATKRTPESFLGWDPESGRLVDGVWAHGRLWLLSSKGALCRYGCGESDNPGLSDRHQALGLHCEKSFTIRPPHRSAIFRALDACETGLAVLASESVTFLWFALPSRESPPEIELVKQGSRWSYVPGAMDCAACLPYPKQKDGLEICASPTEKENPVWTIVSTAGPGLRWIAWRNLKDRKIDINADDRGGERVDSGESKEVPDERSDLWPKSDPANFVIEGSGSVLYVRVGRFGPGRPPFLVCCSRNHKLFVSSILHRWDCDEQLTKWMRERMEAVSKAFAVDSDLSGGDLKPLLSLGDGVKWWFLVRRIKKTLGVSVVDWHSAEDSIEVADLLDCTNRNNLLFLAPLLAAWHSNAMRTIGREVATEGESKRDEIDSSLARWVLLLLQRGTELDPKVMQEIAGHMHASLQESEHDRVTHENCRASLAAFLRKWIVYGPTYDEKAVKLYEVYEFNQRCGRNLDALVYLTKLMRNRVDRLWEAPPPPGSWNPTVWSIVAAQNGEFSIASLSSGSLLVTDRDGRNIPWSWLSPETLEDVGLECSEDGLALRRIGAENFEDRYRVGPYARALWISTLQDKGQIASGEHLLVFCLRGWRREDREGRNDRSPKVFALLLRAEYSTDMRIRKLQIEAADGSELCNELYSLHELEKGEQEFTLVAGTSGSWQHVRSAGEEVWIPSPFIELKVGLSPKFTIEPDRVEIKRLEERERSMFRKDSVVPEAAYNPCWAIARSEDKDGLWLWAGFQDGNILGYRRELAPITERTLRWIEGGSAGEDRRRQIGIKGSGAVWHLHVFEAKGLGAMLAYGTGDGVIGALPIEELMAESRELSRPLPFVIHSKQSSPICGLHDYLDQDDTAAHHCLIAFTQSGFASVFALELEAGHESKERFYFPGLRLDRFKIGSSARATTLIHNSGDNALPRRHPRFLVGSAEGKIYEYELHFPYYGQRRRDVGHHRFNELMYEPRRGSSVLATVSNVSRKGDAEGERLVCQWLRVLQVGDENVIKFSIWLELRKARETIWSNSRLENVNLELAFDAYRGVLESLAREVYRRRPFSKETVKIIWQEGARVANRIAERALGLRGRIDATSRSIYLRHYYELNTLFSDLCNRWIGVEQSIESKVLVHSFIWLFDLTDVFLIAWAEEDEYAKRIRSFLILGLIQRRLSYPEPIVPLETLRVLNRSLIRAIAKKRDFKTELRLRPVETVDAQEPSPGFYDVMTMVGDLWERLSSSLSPSDPLSTEITRFFALSLLLLPDCSILTGQVVSESRLTETGTGLAELILQQARFWAGQLKLSQGPEEIGSGLERFNAYIRGTAALKIAEHPASKPERKSAEWPWYFLLKEAERLTEQTTMEGILSDVSILTEQKHVLWLTSVLSDLKRALPSADVSASGVLDLQQLPDPRTRDAWDWLWGGKAQFFKHSQEYLRRLSRNREGVLYCARLRKEKPEGAQWEEKDCSISHAVELCRDLLPALQREYLFRPQRDHYESVIRRWRDQLVNRAGEAVEVLDSLDKFNRHVYRTAADSLMDSIVNLAMQTAPVSFPELSKRGDSWEDAGSGPLRFLLRRRIKGHPLINQVFETGENLVESTHLAGALLAVARDYIGTPEEFARDVASVEADEIKESVEEACRRMGLKFTWMTGTTEWRKKAPGSKAIWDFIAQEFATNTYKYSHANGKGVTLMAALEEEPGHGGFRVIMASDVPYKLCKTKDEWEDLTKGGPREALGRIHDQLESFFLPGVRGRKGGQGSGMGLHLVRRIVKLCDMKAVQVLYDPGHSEQEFEYSFKKLEWPLCLQISWRPE